LHGLRHQHDFAVLAVLHHRLVGPRDAWANGTCWMTGCSVPLPSPSTSAEWMPTNWGRARMKQRDRKNRRVLVHGEPSHPLSPRAPSRGTPVTPRRRLPRLRPPAGRAGSDDDVREERGRRRVRRAVGPPTLELQRDPLVGQTQHSLLPEWDDSSTSGSRAASTSGAKPRRASRRRTKVATTRPTSLWLGGGAPWKTSAPPDWACTPSSISV
jgi:hypothetical protein